jgi:hypothetical protein
MAKIILPADSESQTIPIASETFTAVVVGSMIVKTGQVIEWRKIRKRNHSRPLIRSSGAAGSGSLEVRLCDLDSLLRRLVVCSLSSSRRRVSVQISVRPRSAFNWMRAPARACAVLCEINIKRHTMARTAALLRSCEGSPRVSGLAFAVSVCPSACDLSSGDRRTPGAPLARASICMAIWYPRQPTAQVMLWTTRSAGPQQMLPWRCPN